MANERSIVEYFYHEEGDSSGHRCGYCKSSDTSISKGMWAHKLTCEDYQDLIDRGWRRSGKYIYKPTMEKTCCPAYTIKCDALNFKPSKSQKKVLKQITKYLKTDCGNKAELSCTTPNTCANAAREKVNPAAKTTETTKKEPRKPDGADPSRPQCRQAKLIRKEKWLKKQSLETAVSKMKNENEGRSLEEHMSDHTSLIETAHKLKRVLLRCEPDSSEFQESYEKSFQLFCKYQKEIHKDEPEKLNKNRMKLLRVDKESEEFMSTLNNSHEVFAKYQMNVHEDAPSECDFSQFKRFLVDSPLIFEKHEATPDTGWGSFHQHYYLDEKLIAVAVLDILPHCLSSVYFFYDTDYSFLSLGIYSTLREIHFTRELHKTSSKLSYYYMGYYIHSCPKMKYKGNYKPSYLACPESFSWVPIEKCQPKLDVCNYSRLDETDKEDEKVDVNQTLILLNRHGLMTYDLYKSLRGTRDLVEVKEYSQLVGATVAARMVLFRS